MITSDEIKEEIEIAFENFGRMPFYDKGPGEVMDIGRILERMLDMNATQIADVLAAVRFTRGGGTFAQHMMCALDDRPDLDALYADPRLQGLY